MAQAYNFSLRNGFPPGALARIKGSLPPNGKSFNINFQTHDDYNVSDIVFHVSVRYGEGVIVMNTKEKTKWQTEVRANTLAIAAGREFEILVTCDPTQFRLAINGLHFADFKMRRSHTHIRAFSAQGDANVSMISFESSGPGFLPGPAGPPYPFPR
uniref:Galectin n=1 Tax=Holotrichia oblita TaxID=644536 RepID=A0A8D4J1K7_HOLOL|nr:lectin 2 [Holotrichia oblita]